MRQTWHILSAIADWCNASPQKPYRVFKIMEHEGNLYLRVQGRPWWRNIERRWAWPHNTEEKKSDQWPDSDC